MSFSSQTIFRKFLLLLVLCQIAACGTNFRQGLQNLEDHNYPAALSFFEKDAVLGHRVPAIYAADLHIIDYQVPRNIEKSKHFLDMALRAEYGRYDQAYDYYIPLIKAYQILADTSESDKSRAFEILNYEKYQTYSWPLYVLAHCHLVGYGTEINLPLAKRYFERAFQHRLNDRSNSIYAWWLSVYPDTKFRNPELALSLLLDADEELFERATFLDTLAAVYAINEQYDQAIKTQMQALSLLEVDIQKYEYMKVYKQAFESRLAHYKRHEPWIYSDEDIRRCGFDAKRCLKASGELELEGSDVAETILIHQ